MLTDTRRYLLVIALLVVAVLIGAGQRWRASAQLEEALPTPVSSADEPLPIYNTYWVDVEGWYRITPYEAAVRSQVDLSGETTEAMAQALPTTLGEWQQVGEDKYIGDDPAVVFYLKHPTVALQRTYQAPSGQRVTLAVIGNVGEDSFLLFSHTPETCYPGRLWQVIESRRESTKLDGATDSPPMHAQYLLTEHAPSGERLLTLYWYLWDDPRRDSEEGVLSMRVNLFVPEDASEEEILEQAWDFVRALFPATIPWDRF